MIIFSYLENNTNHTKMCDIFEVSGKKFEKMD